MNPAALRTAVDEATRSHRRALWGLCYRMTGDAADADDIVQDTLTRALDRPRGHDAAPLDRWLMAVAMNLAKDRLRQRKRRSYPCPWLPAPVETEGENAAPVLDVLVSEQTAAGRYELLESVSFAFLLAVEALTPQQRAVLILRDVFDGSVRDTAECLGITEANVKTTLLRARRAMAAYDRTPRAAMAVRQQETQRVLLQLLECLQANDFEGAVRLLAPSVTSLSDGGGEFHAANVPVVGARKVMLFTSRLNEIRGPPEELALRIVNGLPALLVRYGHSKPREAPLVVFMADVNSEGLVSALHAVLATRKLTAIRFETTAGTA